MVLVFLFVNILPSFLVVCTSYELASGIASSGSLSVVSFSRKLDALKLVAKNLEMVVWTLVSSCSTFSSNQL